MKITQNYVSSRNVFKMFKVEKKYIYGKYTQTNATYTENPQFSIMLCTFDDDNPWYSLDVWYDYEDDCEIIFGVEDFSPINKDTISRAVMLAIGAIESY